MPFLTSSTEIDSLTLQSKHRYPSIDVLRGLIMVIMAVDHASFFWNAGKAHTLEGAIGLPLIDYGNWAQQVTREMTHICAPGFQFLAGLGLSIFVLRRKQIGCSGSLINRNLIIRGLVLCFVDFFVMYWPYGSNLFLFSVLACIGCTFILFSAIRYLPWPIIGICSLIAILATPLYLPDHIVAAGAASYVKNSLLYVALNGTTFIVLYPILPWIGCFGLGWCLGHFYEKHAMLNRRVMLQFGVAMMAFAFVLRLFGGSYAERLPFGDGHTWASFLTVSKYPPSPVFLFATLGVMFALLGLFYFMDAKVALPKTARLFGTIGRTPLFFYVTHIYFYGAYAFISGDKSRYSLMQTYVVWAGGLVVLYPMCKLYDRFRTRYSRVLRFF